MTGIGYGRAGPTDVASQFNVAAFLVNQLIGRVFTSTLVQVKAVASGGEGPVGYVDVQPLVNQVDGQGNAVAHGKIFHLPYFRLQGGTNAIIIDPVVGDIGMASFCDHDISSVKASKARANPASGRRFDMADGLYCGGFLNAAPVQYVEFLSTGIKIVDINGNIILMQPGSVLVTTPDLRCTGKITAFYGTPQQVGLSTHIHSQPNDSHGDTEQPTNAPTAGT